MLREVGEKQAAQDEADKRLKECTELALKEVRWSRVLNKCFLVLVNSFTPTPVSHTLQMSFYKEKRFEAFKHNIIRYTELQVQFARVSYSC